MERTHNKKNNYMLNIMRLRSVEYNNVIVHVQKCHMLRHMMAIWLVLGNAIPESVFLDAVYRCPITLVCHITASTTFALRSILTAAYSAAYWPKPLLIARWDSD